MTDSPKHRLVLSSPHAPQVFHATRLGTFDDESVLEVQQYLAGGRTRVIEVWYGGELVASHSDVGEPLIPLVLTRYLADPAAQWDHVKLSPPPRIFWSPPEPPIASAGTGPDEA